MTLVLCMIIIKEQNVEKEGMNMDYTIEGLRTVIEQYDGIASLEQLQKAGFSRMMIYAGLKDGVLNKEAHGNYSIADQQPDEYRIIQCRSDKVVFSHATALFLHGLSDRVPHLSLIHI